MISFGSSNIPIIPLLQGGGVYLIHVFRVYIYMYSQALDFPEYLFHKLS